MKVVGLDPSEVAFGIGLIRQEPGEPYKCSAFTCRPGDRRGHQRLHFICRDVLEFCAGADLVVVEGAAYGKSFKAFDMGGLFWTVTHMLWKHGIKLAVIPPPTLKVYVAGSGRASKAQMLIAARKTYGDMVHLDDHNQADAFGLAAMGAHSIGYVLREVPEKNARVLYTTRALVGTV
jgi:Holliday junction resolvasome RuvABC endonuclease subunit